MELLQEIKRLAEDGYSMAEAAEILGISYNRLKAIAHEYRIMFKNSYQKSLERKKEFVQLYDSGASRDVIIRKLGISYSTYLIWRDQIHMLRMEVRKLLVNDPRSYVCQQLEKCSHRRCYLSSRCPAYQRYIQERNLKK